MARPSDEEVLAYVEGRLSPSDAAELRAQLAGDEGLARLAHANQALEARGVKPSARLLARALGGPQAYAARVRGVPTVAWAAVVIGVLIALAAQPWNRRHGSALRPVPQVAEIHPGMTAGSTGTTPRAAPPAAVASTPHLAEAPAPPAREPETGRPVRLGLRRHAGTPRGAPPPLAQQPELRPAQVNPLPTAVAFALPDGTAEGEWRQRSRLSELEREALSREPDRLPEDGPVMLSAAQIERFRASNAVLVSRIGEGDAATTRMESTGTNRGRGPGAESGDPDLGPRDPGR